MKADWIETSIDAARQATGEVHNRVIECLGAELESRLSLRSLRPTDLNVLAERLIGLTLPSPPPGNTEPSDANRSNLP